MSGSLLSKENSLKKKKRQFMEPGVGGGRGRARSGKVPGIERGREESSVSSQGSLRKDSI